MAKRIRHCTERVEDSGLTITQERVAVALALGDSISSISSQYGIPPSTIYDWRQLPEFATHYKRLQREAVREIRGQLSTLSNKALETISEMIDGAGEQTRLKAACYVIDQMCGNDREAKRLRQKAKSITQNEKK